MAAGPAAASLPERPGTGGPGGRASSGRIRWPGTGLGRRGIPNTSNITATIIPMSATATIAVRGTVIPFLDPPSLEPPRPLGQ